MRRASNHPLRITLDTNVWTRSVLPERWADHPKHGLFIRLREALLSQKIKGFICESFATAEAVGRRNRARYYVDSIPAVEVRATHLSGNAHSMSLHINARHDQNPGLGEDFEKELTAASQLGIKLLTTPYIGLAVPDRLRNNPHLYTEEVFATTSYNERFGDVVRTINDRGIGEGALAVLATELTRQLDGPRPKEWSDRELILRIYEYARVAGRKKELRQIEEAFAESADGDLVAAHIAIGNDHLCTEDTAKTTHCSSVFDGTNRAWLEAQHGVQFVDLHNLIDLLN